MQATGSAGGLYSSGSITTVSGFGVQTPKGLPRSAFGSAQDASQSIVYERPNYILIQGTGKFTFQTDCTSAVGTPLLIGEVNESGSGVDILEPSQDDTSLRLHLQPCAWSGSGLTDGSVIFVYKGGL